MSGSTTIVYVAASLQHAYLVRDALRDEGIEAFLVDQHLAGAAGELPLGWATLPKLAVASEVAETARRLVRRMELRAARADADSANADSANANDLAPNEPAADEREAAGEPAAAWPVCPECGGRRHTACPVCEEAGDHFPLPEFAGAGLRPRATRGPIETGRAGLGSLDQGSRNQGDRELGSRSEGSPGDASAAGPPWLLCPLCDEVFAPRFHRRCAWCGHDFGDGIATPGGPVQPLEANWGLMLGLLAFALAGGVLWWVMHLPRG